MAKCLNIYYSAEEPLYTRAPFNSDDIIVEDSDIDESPHTKETRNRRREAIGRRYILGHTPLIQTASLRGPFSEKGGWVAPWGRITACLKDQRPANRAKLDNEDTNREGTINPEPKSTALEEFAVASPGEDSIYKHINDDALRYDADNEDDAFEEINDEGRYLHLVGHLDGSRAKHKHLPQSEPEARAHNVDSFKILEKDFRMAIERNGSESSGAAGELRIQENKKKRKMETSWLKGSNVLKRYRYEALEHSSPTPVAGNAQEGNRELYSGCSPHKLDQEILDRQKNPPLLLMSSIGAPASQIGAKKEASSLPVVFQDSDEFFWVTKESAHDFMAQDGQSAAVVCVDSICDIPGQGNINGPVRTSPYQLAYAQSLRQQQVDILQLSPLGLDFEYVNPASSTRQPSRKGLRCTSFQGEDQLSHTKIDNVSAVSDVISDERNTLSHRDGIVDFSVTPSSASEESFHYCRTTRRSDEQNLSLQPQDGEEQTSVVGNTINISEVDIQAMQQMDRLYHHSSSPVFSGNARGLTLQEIRNGGTEKSGRYYHRTTPLSDQDALSEFGVASSPDPLSEDFKGGYQPPTTPIVDQSLGNKSAKSSPDDISVEDCQLLVTKVSPISCQQPDGAQQPALRPLSQLSIPSALEDCTEIPTERTVFTHGQFETALAQGYQFNRSLSSKSTSLGVDNILISQPHCLQETDDLATQPIDFKDNMEPSRGDIQVPEEPARSLQSPWRAISAESPQPDHWSEVGLRGSIFEIDNSVKWQQRKVLPFDQSEFSTMASSAEEESLTDDADRGGKDGFKLYQSLSNKSIQSSDEPGQSPPRLPSTQTLIDATTSNPWNSAFKKPRRRRSDKRVSFGPLPSEEVSGTTSGASPKPLERMESPPPPAGTLRLTQLDDPFHHRLKATRNLEVTEESLTKFMNTPWDDIAALETRAKSSSSSPAVAAMAEAFIAADQQILNKKLGIKDGPTYRNPAFARTSAIESPKDPRVWAAPEQPELRDSPLKDASFSIAPNGKVTAVCIETPHYDAEDNLHAVIEEMGNFLQGWDVESELKKAKVHKLGKGNDTKVPRKREYLSGVSNR